MPTAKELAIAWKEGRATRKSWCYLSVIEYIMDGLTYVVRWSFQHHYFYVDDAVSLWFKPYEQTTA